MAFNSSFFRRVCHLPHFLANSDMIGALTPIVLVSSVVPNGCAFA